MNFMVHWSAGGTARKTRVKAASKRDALDKFEKPLRRDVIAGKTPSDWKIHSIEQYDDLRPHAEEIELSSDKNLEHRFGA